MSSVGSTFANQGVQETLHNVPLKSQKGSPRKYDIFSMGCGESIRSNHQTGVWESYTTDKKDLTRLAEGCCQYHNVFGDGTYWAVKLESRVNRSKAVPCARAGQWLQRYDTVRIEVVWIRVCSWHASPRNCTYIRT